MLLQSHRGWDLGILDIFDYLKKEADFSAFSTISRLLIEKNRSLHHKDLFSEITKPLSSSLRYEIIKEFYLPYRNEVELNIKTYINKGEDVLHLSLHSFTPILNGKIRNTDIGILYDPKKEVELFWVKKMKLKMESLANFKIRRNYPYLGTADGFTTYLRKKFPKNYSGIEIELNQGLLKDGQFSLPLKQNLKAMILDL